MAAGTVTITEERLGNVKKVTFAWTSGTAGEAGTAAGTTTYPYTGNILRVVTVPGTDATKPTDNYDLTLTDEDSRDMARGQLANRDDTNTETITSALGLVVGDKLTLNVSNAGAGKTGSCIVFVGSEPLTDVVGSPDIVVTVTPTVGAGGDFTFDAGDLMFDSTEIPCAVRVNGGTTILQSVVLLDKSDQGTAMTLVFANAATDFGTIDSAPDPDDTESLTVLGTVAITASDYVDLGANRVATVKNIGLLLQAGASTTSLYVAGINGTGTPTYEASGLVFQFGLLRS